MYSGKSMILSASVGVLMLAGVMSSFGQVEMPLLRAGYQLERIERIECDVSDPIRPKYDWDRLASTRHLLGVGVVSADTSSWYAGGLLGLGLNEVHNGEGETVEYDAVFMGAEGSYARMLIEALPLGVLGRARYLVSLPENGTITEVAQRDDLTAGSTSELSWKELTLGLSLTLRYDLLRFEAGLEYVSRDITQDWTLAGEPTTSSTLTPDSDVGVLVGGTYSATESLAFTFGMTVKHQVSFRAGAQYTF